jgi:hypothetical protein
LKRAHSFAWPTQSIVATRTSGVLGGPLKRAATRSKCGRKRWQTGHHGLRGGSGRTHVRRRDGQQG